MLCVRHLLGGLRTHWVCFYRMKVSRENYVRGARMRKIWGEEALDFQEKLLNSSGLGDETYFPDSAYRCRN